MRRHLMLLFFLTILIMGQGCSQRNADFLESRSWQGCYYANGMVSAVGMGQLNVRGFVVTGQMPLADCKEALLNSNQTLFLEGP